ncbi:MAG TPA: 3-oxoacyl-[acyl-carrier-protein] synthase III C-terminal domain-containing protein [Bacteroidales bacterium]|nr:3-oxoacyl-[acyl-carrier-protein] synthase III C-terminal domain-containing protein [Bacteroidales bacterium]HRW86704.1 3-oxoacyl-[acyl-carrier-protein] synthase III C-terminal domain-containing protein [Bacteroidales bacterium]
MNLGCKIESIGVRLPEKTVTTFEIVNRLRKSKPFKLELITGISERRVCSDNEDTLSLALDASLDCLKYSGREGKDIDMIISTSITKYVNGLTHQYEPAISFCIKQGLGNTRALTFDITNACAGMMTGVHIANNFISRGIIENCLVVSGEYISQISNNAEKSITSPKHPEVACLTVGDAGAAVILSRSENSEDRLLVSDMYTFSEFSALCVGYQSRKYPGAVMKTEMQRIHEVSIEYAPPLIKEALVKAGLRMKDIDFLIPHQTSITAIRSGANHFSRYFGETPGEGVINLSNTGNTASTTHFATLYKYLKEKRIDKGSKIMLLSFASGLVIGITIFSVYDLIQKYGNSN